MKPGRLIFICILLFTFSGCKQVSKSLTVSRHAVDEFHRKDSAALCDRFSSDMLDAMPFDSLERVISQTVQAVGEPVGECRWHYGYQIVGLDPFRTVTVYKCPHEKETLKVFVVLDVGTEEGTVVSGLWADSPIIRDLGILLRVELCPGVEENTMRCQEELEHAGWSMPRVYLWTEWQNVKKGDRLIMEWQTPDGRMIHDYVHEVKPHSSNTYMFWSWIEPHEIPADMHSDEVVVKIGINGREVESFPVKFIQNSAE